MLPSRPYTEKTIDTNNTIPRDLFPKTTRNINREWARLTYKYFHCFDNSVRATVYHNDNDLQKWESCALSLMEEIKEKGVIEAQNEIVGIAKKRFRLKTNDNEEICSLQDVVDLFKNRKWYNEDVDHKRYILYTFQYGIFRSTSNTWMHEAAYDWMHAHKVKYMDEDISKTGRKKKVLFMNYYI